MLAETGDGSLGPDRLTVANGFAGSTGLFRFSPDGLVEHRFSVMEVQPDAVRVVAPAPQAFGEIVSGAPVPPPVVESPPIPAPSLSAPGLPAPTLEPLPPAN